MLRVQTGVKTALARSVELMVVDKVRLRALLLPPPPPRLSARRARACFAHRLLCAPRAWQVITPLGALIKAMPTLKRQMDARRQALLGAPPRWGMRARCAGGRRRAVLAPPPFPATPARSLRSRA